LRLLANAGWPNAISVGLPALRPTDSLIDLIDRADHSLAGARDRGGSPGQDRASI
jgi:hypothetical protein